MSNLFFEACLVGGQEHCHQCQGSGTVRARREVRVNIPPGK
jgi:DnaJ-class molecular chaperone